MKKLITSLFFLSYLNLSFAGQTCIEMKCICGNENIPSACYQGPNKCCNGNLKAKNTDIDPMMGSFVAILVGNLKNDIKEKKYKKVIEDYSTYAEHLKSVQEEGSLERLTEKTKSTLAEALKNAKNDDERKEIEETISTLSAKHKKISESESSDNSIKNENGPSDCEMSSDREHCITPNGELYQRKSNVFNHNSDEKRRKLSDLKDKSTTESYRDKSKRNIKEH